MTHMGLLINDVAEPVGSHTFQQSEAHSVYRDTLTGNEPNKHRLRRAERLTPLPGLENNISAPLVEIVVHAGKVQLER